MKKIGRIRNFTAICFFSSVLLTLSISCRQHRPHRNAELRQTSTNNIRNQNPESTTMDEENFTYNKELLTPKKQRKIDEVIIERKSYLCSFNKTLRCANWSAWYLTKEHSDGPYRRKDLNIPGNYKEDDKSLEGRQLLSDWFNIGEYDHGHLCPSGDNKWSLAAMEETFYLSNMCVQNCYLNQGPWESLESKCRGWAKKFGGLYIVTGPIFNNKAIRKIGNDLAIPDQFFKVILDIDSKHPKAIAFLYDNITPGEHDKIESHVCSIDEIERISGFDFFYTLSDSIEKSIESNSNINDWKIYKK